MKPRSVATHQLAKEKSKRTSVDAILKAVWDLRLIHVLLLGVFFLPIMYARGQDTDSAEINRLLADARADAISAEYDADILDSYTHGNLSPQAHSIQLVKMREHVNDLGKVGARLVDLRDQGSPWQRVAIDRINPLLGEMARQLQITIELMSNQQDLRNNLMYQDFTHSNYDLESRTAAMISDFVEYGKAKAKAERLEKKLELPTKEK